MSVVTLDDKGQKSEKL